MPLHYCSQSCRWRLSRPSRRLCRPCCARVPSAYAASESADSKLGVSPLSEVLLVAEACQSGAHVPSSSPGRQSAGVARPCRRASRSRIGLGERTRTSIEAEWPPETRHADARACPPWGRRCVTKTHLCERRRWSRSTQALRRRRPQQATLGGRARMVTLDGESDAGHSIGQRPPCVSLGGLRASSPGRLSPPRQLAGRMATLPPAHAACARRSGSGPCS